jgi:hypothetical protein
MSSELKAEIVFGPSATSLEFSQYTNPYDNTMYLRGQGMGLVSGNLVQNAN